MSTARKTIDQITRLKSAIDGMERIPGRDDLGDFRTLLSDIAAYVQSTITFPGVATHDIYNMQLSNNVDDATNDINIAIGFCWDVENEIQLKLTTALTKKLDVNFAEGTDQGMLQAGQTKANSTTYHVYAMTKADGTSDIQATASDVAFVLETGFSYKRRIGLIKTESDGVIRAFNHTWQNKTYMWKTKTVLNSWQVPTTATLTALDVPLGVEVNPISSFSTGIPAGSSATALPFNFYSFNETPPTLTNASSVDGNYNGLISATGQVLQGAREFSNFDIFKTNTSAQIYAIRYNVAYYSTYYSTLQTLGFKDFTV